MTKKSLKITVSQQVHHSSPSRFVKIRVPADFSNRPALSLGEERVAGPARREAHNLVFF